jgi:hypothetical protein
MSKLTTFKVRQALLADPVFKAAANKRGVAERSVDTLVACKQLTMMQAETLYNWASALPDGKARLDMVVAHGSDKPVPNVIGREFKLKAPYQGCTTAKVVESIGRNAFGVPLYGCHLPGYSYGGKPITVDFAASEFVWEQGEAYQEQADKFLKWMGDILKG